MTAELLASSCLRSSSTSALCLPEDRAELSAPRGSLHEGDHPPKGCQACRLLALLSPGRLLAQPLLLLGDLRVEPAPLLLQRLLLLLQLLLTPWRGE